MKKWHQSRTVWLGIFTLLGGVADGVVGVLQTNEVSAQSITVAVLGAVIVWLRTVTTEPIE